MVVHLYNLSSFIMKEKFVYKLLDLVSLVFTYTKNSKFFQVRRNQIIDFGIERALRDSNPPQYRWGN